jgi:hypothetical protein
VERVEQRLSVNLRGTACPVKLITIEAKSDAVNKMQ